MESPFKANGCFYEDDKGTVFSVSTFIPLNELPDARLRVFAGSDALLHPRSWSRSSARNISSNAERFVAAYPSWGDIQSRFLKLRNIL